ncbi:MAG TPA: LPS export ABC transporter permease LptG [Thermohalobaculum sp.]|nr:LPS export ABC transporter permease LptG [Thermohalobaculum sp.]
MTRTLGLYLARRFLQAALAVFLGIFVLVVLIDLVELGRSNADGGADLGTLLTMALLHAPTVIITIAPFAVLLAALATYARLARSSELVVARSSGVSLRALLTPTVLAAMLLGVVDFAVYNPLAAAFASRFETLEARYLDNMRSRLSVSGDGLWLRQSDEGGQTVIHAGRASGRANRLWNVIVFQFDPDDTLYRRIDAQTAVLRAGAWELNVARQWNLARLGSDEARPAEARAVELEQVAIPTDLTPERIIDNFAPPETISFWDLPRFIAELDRAGFSTDRHRLHFHSLMTAPVLFAAMVLIGAAFSMRHVRFGGLGWMAFGCLLTGFGYFFLADLAATFGASGAVPPVLAAWGPPSAAVLFALGLLLQFEDG